jgi:hypothetical protein
MMVPMAGGTPTVLARDYQEAGAIIASNGWLYWSAFRSGSVSKLQVGLSPGQTATPIPLAEGYFGVGQISVGPDLLSFVVYDGPLFLEVREPERSGIVATVPLTGGPVRILQRMQPSLSDVLLDGPAVYWTCKAGVRTVLLAATTPTAARSLAESNGGYPMSLAKSGPILYWTDMDEGAIYSLAIGSQDPVATPIVSNLDMPYRLARDATHLYWTSYTENGSVMRCTLTGASPEVLASNQEYPAGITVDNENIYWVNMIEEGTVMKLPKPESRAR